MAELADSSDTTALINPIAICEQGLATLTDLAIESSPGAIVQLKISIPVLGEQIPDSVDIMLEECPVGHFESVTTQGNVVCEPCKPLFYEVDQSCKPCVDGMQCDRAGARPPPPPRRTQRDERLPFCLPF